MKTFNIDLWETIKNNLTGQDETLDGRIFFGVAPEKAKTPYCVIHVLNGGEDSNAQTLCQNDPDYQAVGFARIQFNIYATNDMWLDEIREDLNKHIKSLRELENYRILSRVLLRSKNASSFTNETGTGLTEFEFKYEPL
jgi:Tfp pilus assembly pilus retraction ATPase PilT